MTEATAESRTSVSDVAKYILQKHAVAELDRPAMTAMKLQKLVYYDMPGTSPGRPELSSRKRSRHRTSRTHNPEVARFKSCPRYQRGAPTKLRASHRRNSLSSDLAEGALNVDCQ